MACSNAYANSINHFSEYARPMSDRPMGSPEANPAGTVIFGQAETASRS